MTRPYTWNIHRSGAANNQGMVLDPATGLWKPRAVVLTVNGVDPDADGDVAVAGGSAHTIQDEGTPLTQRANLDFVGAGVTVTDDGVDTTTVTIPGAAGGTTVYGPDDITQFNTVYGTGITTYDEEFGRSGSPTTLPTGWSWVNQGTSTYVERFNAGIIAPQAGASDNWRAITRALPSESTWTAIAKVSHSFSESNVQAIGLALRESGTGEFTGLIRDATTIFYLTRFNSPTSFNSNPAQIRSGWNQSPFYMRIKRNSATSYDFGWSPDGIVWRNLASAHDPSGFLTPNEIGFFINAAASSQAFEASIHWFRVR